MSNINAVYVQPNKKAEVVTIGNDLHSLQEAVGGLIESFYPFDEPVAIICNDEGKIKQMPLNRALYRNGKLIDIVAGSFLIVGAPPMCKEFESLSESRLNYYKNKFELPERFYKVNGKIVAEKYEITIENELYQKLYDEYNEFVSNLRTMGADEIIQHSYEKVFKENILMAFDSMELTDEKLKALLSEEHPLDAIYNKWCKIDDHMMSDLSVAIEETATDAVKHSRHKSSIETERTDRQ